MVGKPTILVVDDEEQIRESLVEYIEIRGHRAIPVADAEAALEQVRNGIDLVITDQRLPRTTGLNLIRAIREFRPELPVFMITGYADLATVQEARGLGAVAFFKKPLDLKELGRRLDDLLGESDKQRLHGKLLVLSKDLFERLGEKLSFCDGVIYISAEETDRVLEFIHQEKPTAILGEVGMPFTLELLDEYRRQKFDQAAFLVAGEVTEFDQIAAALFEHRADGGIDVSAPAEQIAETVLRCVEQLQADKQQQRQLQETLIDRCMYAGSFQRGRHCTYQGPCSFREGWVVINGVEHQKCGKKPLHFDDWNRVGLYVWPVGPVTLEKVQECRREVSDMIKLGKKDIVFDLVHVKELHMNLIEIISDICDELIATHHDGTIPIINLHPELQGEYRIALDTPVVKLRH